MQQFDCFINVLIQVCFRLKVLNVSYNNLSADDVRVLSCLPLLRTLFLSGNGLSTLPQDLSQTSIDGSG